VGRGEFATENAVLTWELYDPISGRLGEKENRRGRVVKKKAAKKSAKKGKKGASNKIARRSSAQRRSVAPKKKRAVNRGSGRAAAASKKSTSKRPAAKKSGPKKSSPKKLAAKKTAGRGAAGSSLKPAGVVYGEGNWKADEEYREGLKDFSETHNAEQLAREAAEEMEGEEGPNPKRGEGSEEDSEW
jgi:hypothetical protein